MEQDSLAKTYRRAGPQWTRLEVCSVLNDASDMAKTHGTIFVVGEDDDGVVVACPQGSLSRDAWLICSTVVAQSPAADATGATAPAPAGRQGTEWNLEAYSRWGTSCTGERLQTDDAALRVLDCLNCGIMEFGSLMDMTGGRAQLAAALDGARFIQKRRGGRLICGIRRGRADGHSKNVVSISQMSKREEFVESLAAVISDDAVFMLNRPQNAARLGAGLQGGDPDAVWYDVRERIVNRIYFGGWGAPAHLYGVLESGKDGITMLQDEMADLAIMCRDRVYGHDDMLRIDVDTHGHLKLDPRGMRAAADTSIDIDCRRLVDGRGISKDAVAQAAQDAVQRFSKLRPFAPYTDEQGRLSANSFPGPEEGYPMQLPGTPDSDGLGAFPVVHHDYW